MSDRVVLAPDLAPALSAAGLASAEALLTLGDADAEAPHVVAEVALDVPGTIGRFHLKRYHYAGWGRSKGLVGRGTLWGRAPEVNEFRALTRLHEIGVPAVRPVAAAARTRGGRLVAHALLTEHVPDATDLAHRLRAADDPVGRDPATRRRVLTWIGRHLARMHAEGFVHGDCHARNILVRTEEDEEVHVWFLDCRRGGNATPRRGPFHDLATLDADLKGLVPVADRLRALRAWLPEDEPSRKHHARVARRRERLVRRDARRGRTRR